MSLDTGTRLGSYEVLGSLGAGGMPFYDLARDGKRGITAMPVGKTTRVSSLSLVQNWQREFAGK